MQSTVKRTMTIPIRSLTLLRAGLVLALGLTPASPLSRAADANPPDRLSYQGYLTDANAQPLGNNSPTNYDIVFRIYDVSQGGDVSNLLWAEQQTVTVDKGYFSVMLGEGGAVDIIPKPTLASVFGGPTASDRFIGITVKGLGATDLEIAPRLRLLTSPYSFLAQNAGALVSNAGGLVVTAASGSVGIKTETPQADLDVNGTARASAFVGNGAGLTGINAGNLTSGTVPIPQIPNLDASKITSGTLSTARIPGLSGAQIVSGVIGSARLPDLDASKTTTGTFNPARIPNLDASKITTGTLSDARLSGNVAKLNATGTQNFAGSLSIRNGDDLGGLVVRSATASTSSIVQTRDITFSYPNGFNAGNTYVVAAKYTTSTLLGAWLEVPDEYGIAYAGNNFEIQDFPLTVGLGTYTFRVLLVRVD
ncbi:MAG: hypothetical protein H7A47_09070 [Verrucomicrobiales bacterium]|nr:hypothetical protein [Verrucomicrobiales bacterium]